MLAIAPNCYLQTLHGSSAALILLIQGIGSRVIRFVHGVCLLSTTVQPTLLLTRSYQIFDVGRYIDDEDDDDEYVYIDFIG